MTKSKPNTKLNRNPKPTRKASPKPQAGSSQIDPAPTVYRKGTLYCQLFEAAKDYINKSELFERVAQQSGKSEKVISFAYAVLKNPSHRSNKKRSTELKEGDKVKLIPIRKPLL